MREREIEVVMKPCVQSTLMLLEKGEYAVFRSPDVKPGNVRMAAYFMNKKCTEKLFACTEKGYPDGIEVRRVQ